jgi:hypothetical protein
MLWGAGGGLPRWPRRPRPRATTGARAGLDVVRPLGGKPSARITQPSAAHRTAAQPVVTSLTTTGLAAQIAGEGSSTPGPNERARTSHRGPTRADHDTPERPPPPPGRGLWVSVSRTHNPPVRILFCLFYSHGRGSAMPKGAVAWVSFGSTHANNAALLRGDSGEVLNATSG